MPNYHNLFEYEYKEIQEGNRIVYWKCRMLKNIEELKTNQKVFCIVPTISMLVWTSEEDMTEYTEVQY